MACQPAIQIGAFLLVTFDALAHTPVFSRQTVLILHLTVTLSAGYFLVDVPLMVKEYMLGNIVDFFPWGGAPGIKIAVLLLNPWVLGNDIVMTVKAFFNRRYTRKGRIGHIGMTVLTLYLFNPDMYVVAEGYGLFRSHCIGRDTIEQKQEASRENQRQQGQQDGCLVFSQRSAPSFPDNSGKTCRKKPIARAMSPKKPSEINPSEKPREMVDAP